MDDEDRSAKIGITMMACVFVALTLALSIFRFLDTDEIEHLHSTWYVLTGALPYVDFFQHHHPLLWYVLAPMLTLTGQSAAAVIVFRVAFFTLTLAILWATYRLALECRASREAARLAVLLLVSMTTFVYVAIEIRPDVPQVFFSVLSVLYLVRLFRTRAARDAVLSGIAAGLALLFLQKAVLLLALYPLPFVVHAVRRQLPWRLGLYWSAAFVVTCLPFVAFLAATGSLDEYLVTNWLLNAYMGAGRARVSFLSPFVIRDFARNAVFWSLATGMAAALLRGKFKADYAVPAWLGLGLVAEIFAINRVVDRYVVAAVPFLAVAVAAWLTDQFTERKVRGARAVAALLIVCFVPGVAMVRSVGRSNAGQLARIQYVLDHSRADDRVYDELRDFNLFRPDLHYAWFLSRLSGKVHSRLTGDRYADYDVCRAIDTMKPRFVSNREGDLERCGLIDQYRPTSFAILFVRADR